MSQEIKIKEVRWTGLEKIGDEIGVQFAYINNICVAWYIQEDGDRVNINLYGFKIETIENRDPQDLRLYVEKRIQETLSEFIQD